MTEQANKWIKWLVPILASLTALVAVEELRNVRGAVEILGLVLAVATAVFGYIAAMAKPEAPAPQAPQPLKAK